VIRQIEGNRFPVGELDGQETERVRRLSEILTAAGFKSRILSEIRAEIWLKAWGNLAFNPISAMTHATLEDMCRFGPTRELARMMMEEAAAVAAKLGIAFRVTIDRRIAGAESVGAHKTSMLQDVESGRELETEALIGAIAELARLTRTPTPHIDAVLACTRLLGDQVRKSGGLMKMICEAAQNEAARKAASRRESPSEETADRPLT
jgi:2-dehydropantoate 2-reductase